MDLNHLLYQHQVALIGAARNAGEACAHQADKVRHFAHKIRTLQSELGVPLLPAAVCGLPA